MLVWCGGALTYTHSACALNNEDQHPQPRGGGGGLSSGIPSVIFIPFSEGPGLGKTANPAHHRAPLEKPLGTEDQSCPML